MNKLIPYTLFNFLVTMYLARRRYRAMITPWMFIFLQILPWHVSCSGCPQTSVLLSHRDSSGHFVIVRNGRGWRNQRSNKSPTACIWCWITSGRASLSILGRAHRGHSWVGPCTVDRVTRPLGADSPPPIENMLVSVTKRPSRKYGTPMRGSRRLNGPQWVDGHNYEYDNFLKFKFIIITIITAITII